MTRLAFDARWCGQFGIARYGTELRKRLTGDVLDVYAPGEPFDIPGMAAWEARTGREWLRNRGRLLLSPSFTPSLAWRGAQAITVHDLIHIDVAEESSSKKALYYNHVILSAVRRNPVTFTVSQYSKRRIIEWSGVDPERILVTGNAASGDFTPDGPRHSPGYPYVFYVRNAKPHKNSARLVRAFAQLDHPDLRLVLSGPADEPTFRLARELGVGDRVIAAGSIPEDDLPAYYRGASVVAFPSLYEGFGIPALEAMACGTPLVASNTTSLPEVVGDAALLVDPVSAEDIAAGLDRALTDADVRERLRTAGPQRAALFTWDAIADTVSSTLENI